MVHVLAHLAEQLHEQGAAAGGVGHARRVVLLAEEGAPLHLGLQLRVAGQVRLPGQHAVSHLAHGISPMGRASRLRRCGALIGDGAASPAHGLRPSSRAGCPPGRGRAGRPGGGGPVAVPGGLVAGGLRSRVHPGAGRAGLDRHDLADRGGRPRPHRARTVRRLRAAHQTRRAGVRRLVRRPPDRADPPAVRVPGAAPAVAARHRRRALHVVHRDERARRRQRRGRPAHHRGARR